MEKLNLIQVQRQHKMNAKSAAKKLVSLIENDEELSKLRIGEVDAAFDLAKVYIKSAYGQVPLRQAFIVADCLPDENISLDPALVRASAL